MKKFLDDNGFAYFWSQLKPQIVQTVNTNAPDETGNASLGAHDVPWDNNHSTLANVNVQDAIKELDENLNYNAIYSFDATNQSAPPNLPRGYNWHIDMIGPMIGEHQYSRYFYLDIEDAKLDQTGTPLVSNAVAHWVIDGRRMYFEYLENGIVNTVIDITDSAGNVLIPKYRPIPRYDVWFFGKNQTDPFPTDDNTRSILDINVRGLTAMIGNTFDLTTDNKEIVGALNEINAKSTTIQIHEEATPEDALLYSQSHPDVFVFVARN